MQNPRTVCIDGATFFVNSFSRSNATETGFQLLRRTILRNAERELKAGFSDPGHGGKYHAS
jgi:hypothetical protein